MKNKINTRSKGKAQHKKCAHVWDVNPDGAIPISTRKLNEVKACGYAIRICRRCGVEHVRFKYLTDVEIDYDGKVSGTDREVYRYDGETTLRIWGKWKKRKGIEPIEPPVREDKSYLIVDAYLRKRARNA